MEGASIVRMGNRRLLACLGITDDNKADEEREEVPIPSTPSLGLCCAALRCATQGCTGAGADVDAVVQTRAVRSSLCRSQEENTERRDAISLPLSGLDLRGPVQTQTRSQRRRRRCRLRGEQTGLV